MLQLKWAPNLALLLKLNTRKQTTARARVLVCQSLPKRLTRQMPRFSFAALSLDSSFAQTFDPLGDFLAASDVAYSAQSLQFTDSSPLTRLYALDQAASVATHSSLLFGGECLRLAFHKLSPVSEVLPLGVSKLLDPTHLNAAKCQKLVDLGGGLGVSRCQIVAHLVTVVAGKLALQAFYLYPNLKTVASVELAHSRAFRGMHAWRIIAQTYPQRSFRSVVVC